MDHQSEVSIYRYLLDGGTIRCTLPGNEKTIKIVDDIFCSLQKDGSWKPYPLIISKASSWNLINEH